jgi:hypothetical protein
MPVISKTLASAIIVVALSPSVVWANNAACWGHGQDDPDRYDISCTNLTERFLLSMVGATRSQVLKAMGAKGRQTGEDTLHFISNAGYGEGWDGPINFRFKDDAVVEIMGSIDGPGGHPDNMEFVWNADKGVVCSDFPGSDKRCEPTQN